MSIGVLSLVGLSPERVASLTAASYVVREGKKYANRIDAVREAGDSVRAVLTNGRGGLVPPILPEILKFENVVVTPHCAGRAPEARSAATALILDNLNAYFAGKPLVSPVSLNV